MKRITNVLLVLSVIVVITYEKGLV